VQCFISAVKVIACIQYYAHEVYRQTDRMAFVLYVITITKLFRPTTFFAIKQTDKQSYQKTEVITLSSLR